MKTLYLAEILGLSSDKPISMYRIKKAALEQRLCASPAIKKGSISLLEPGVVVVNYTMREPIALLADYVNVAIDDERRVFPLEPYFGQKKLPEIIVGAGEYEPWPGWGQRYESERLGLAFSILSYYQSRHSHSGLRVLRLDVQKALSQSADREMVLQLQGNKKYTLRLSVSDWNNDLERFFSLYPIHIETALFNAASMRSAGALESVKNDIALTKDIVLDLRLPKLAFIVSSSEKK